MTDRSLSEQLVAIKFANEKGYRLLGTRQVVFEAQVFDALALVRERSPINTIDEFILRCIEIEISDLDRVSKVLSLPSKLIKSHLVELFRSSHVEGTAAKLSLTDLGTALCRDFKAQREFEYWYKGVKFHSVMEQIIAFDGNERGLLLREFEVRESDLVIVAPTNAQGKQAIPRPGELSKSELSNYDIEFGVERDVLKILHVKGTEKLLYQQATLLHYEAKGRTGEYRYAFTIHGDQLDPVLERSFVDKGSSDLLPKGMQTNPPPRTAEEVLTDFVPESIRGILTKSLQQDAPLVSSEIESKRGTFQRIENVPTADASNDELREKLHRERAEKAELQSSGRTSVVQAWDHPEILRSACMEAQTSLVITSGFVNARTISSLEVHLVPCLKRGVEVTLIFGMPEDPGHERKHYMVQGARQAQRLADQHQNLTVIDAPTLDWRKGQGTHAKILIKDDDYALVGSYNWLSYESDESQKYIHRDETSLLTSDPQAINQLGKDIREQYSRP